MTQIPFMFVLVVVSFTGVLSRSCIPPPGPQGRPGDPPRPPPVCQSPCSCPTEQDLAATCQGGLVTGVCNCACSVCAKQEGECCGGWRNFQGKCDVGLRCRPGPPPPQPPPGPGGSSRLPGGIPGGIPVPGKCVKI